MREGKNVKEWENKSKQFSSSKVGIKQKTLKAGKPSREQHKHVVSRLEVKAKERAKSILKVLFLENG